MTTDSYSFTQFTKAARDCSRILEPAEISILLETKDYEPLLLFMHRIAAYVSADVRNSNEFRNLDDSDFIDAAQECTEDMRTIIDARPEKFSGYAAVTFRRRIRRYLAAVNNGGLGSYSADILRPISLIDPFYDETDEDSANTQLNDATEDLDIPIGLGNPEDELIRLETVTAALETLKDPAKTGGHGPKRDTEARAKRLQRQLGIDDPAVIAENARLQGLEIQCPVCHVAQ
jgi:hypothetical protein